MRYRRQRAAPVLVAFAVGVGTLSIASRGADARVSSHASGRVADVSISSKAPGAVGDTPEGFWYGTDSWPTPVAGSAPYREPITGGSYGGYIGMIGNWAYWYRCNGGFLAQSPANRRQASTNYLNYGRGIGTGVYWFMGGPGVDPNFNGSTSEAFKWGARQAARALSDLSATPVTYPVVFMDVELPGIQPAPDNGWIEVYTSPCSGIVRSKHVAPSLDRADFNGFWDYIKRRSRYVPGVYSSPGVWRSIFGTGSASRIPHTDEWTYEPETSNLRQAPSGWCLKGTSSCAEFFGGVTRASREALVWQWSGGDAVRNGYGDFDQIDTNALHP